MRWNILSLIYQRLLTRFGTIAQCLDWNKWCFWQFTQGFTWDFRKPKAKSSIKWLKQEFQKVQPWVYCSFISEVYQSVSSKTLYYLLMAFPQLTSCNSSQLFLKNWIKWYFDNIFWQLYLIKLQGLLTGLRLLEFEMLVFVTNLRFMEFPVALFALISFFLRNRQLQAVLDVNSSQEYPVTAGFPQGSTYYTFSIMH